MSKKQPKILITNDDGIGAKGIASLVRAVEKIGEVTIVAPDKPQSGMGHAITVNDILRIRKSPLFSDHEAYSTSGTPADCIKLGIDKVMGIQPDLILSGINHGENSGTNVLYSGTMSAAIEGATNNIPSIGFSLLDFDQNADFSTAVKIVQKVVEKVLENSFPDYMCLNVNIPKCEYEELKGIKVCKQANSTWNDSFTQRDDQFGNPYFWMMGEFSRDNPEKETDIEALDNGYVSIVPIQFDLTAYKNLEEVTNWDFNL